MVHIKKTKWRLYCENPNCNNYIIVKWGGGYGCVINNNEEYADIRNQCYVCDEHKRWYE